MRFSVPAALMCLGLVLAWPQPAYGQTADNVLLVINANSPESLAIGEHYTKVRGIAPDHIVRIETAPAESISRVAFERTIEAPISIALASRDLQDRILYIVLTKGVPLRIMGTGGRDGTAASVDSELTLLYRKLLGTTVPVIGRVGNPYFVGAEPRFEARRFTRFASDVYLVTRLDGFTVDDAIALVDRAASAVPRGRIVLDEKSTWPDRGGDEWLRQAAERLGATRAAEEVLLETTRDAAVTADFVIGYYSWGSNDPSLAHRRSGLTFSPGAIGAMYVSTDGRTFSEPPPTWTPSGPNGGPVFGGSFQSLAGDLIRDGVSGVAAHVNEPYLDATIRPQILFPAYVSGLNLAESFYLAMPYLSWQTVVVGDPLCSPFAGTPLAPSDLDKGLDPETGLPALFVERRLAMAAEKGLNPAAVKLILRVERDIARGERANLETLLVRAAELEPRLIAAQIALAELYVRRQEYEKSIDRYRRVLEVDPNDTAVLNNLAYYLAEHGGAPEEALPLAQRAYRLAPEPAMADTVGWIHHLLGDDNAAVPFVEIAVSRLPGHPDVLIHAATVHLAVRQAARARVELDAAEKLDLSESQRAAVKALRERLERP